MKYVSVFSKKKINVYVYAYTSVFVLVICNCDLMGFVISSKLIRSLTREVSVKSDLYLGLTLRIVLDGAVNNLGLNRDASPFPVCIRCATPSDLPF